MEPEDDPVFPVLRGAREDRVAPTSLLAARPEVGRAEDTLGVRVIRVLSARGILVGTVRTAQLPALYAATSPQAERGAFYAPGGPGGWADRPRGRSSTAACGARTTPVGSGNAPRN